MIGVANLLNLSALTRDQPKRGRGPVGLRSLLTRLSEELSAYDKQLLESFEEIDDAARRMQKRSNRLIRHHKLKKRLSNLNELVKKRLVQTQVVKIHFL